MILILLRCLNLDHIWGLTAPQKDISSVKNAINILKTQILWKDIERFTQTRYLCSSVGMNPVGRPSHVYLTIRDTYRLCIRREMHPNYINARNARKPFTSVPTCSAISWPILQRKKDSILNVWMKVVQKHFTIDSQCFDTQRHANLTKQRGLTWQTLIPALFKIVVHKKTVRHWRVSTYSNQKMSLNRLRLWTLSMISIHLIMGVWSTWMPMSWRWSSSHLKSTFCD